MFDRLCSKMKSYPIKYWRWIFLKLFTVHPVSICQFLNWDKGEFVYIRLYKNK